MTIRERQEALERETLSPFAAKSAESRGRARPIPACDLRTEFQRDRDRILHAASFRRLKHKTQMFLAPENDHYRTRLTHTLEVAQIARTLARCLRLNEDLTEAIALGHDLGHTPFGHMGERTLDRLLESGFKHREQSLRVVERLERGGEGLNLTWETRDGILHHSGATPPATLEGQCVSRADRIAYINHDIEDAVRAGVLREGDVPRVLGASHGERIDRMIHDIVRESGDGQGVRMSAEVREAAETLRDFLFERVYRSPWALAEESRANRLIEALFRHTLAYPETMPKEYALRADTDGLERSCADYIAGMTDHYAARVFERIYLPSAFAGDARDANL